MKLQPLPIDSHLPKILSELQAHGNLILKAAPGSGKTTRVPPALLQSTPKEVLVLEPRRLAAKYSALRVAHELNEQIGQTVGYQFRYENVGGAATRLRFLTEGMLMRKLMSDPALKSVGVVVLDEFHERHIHSDLALNYLRTLQKGKRPDLRLLVMSATLDTDGLSQFLGNAPVLEVAHRPFPVTVHYQASASKYLELQVRDALIGVLNASDDDGDILVFLPGKAEIRRTEEVLNDYFKGEPARPQVFLLHGELSREEQDLALKRLDPHRDGSKRKVILSTNVAETSLTIEGITTVIDSGLHRIATYSWWTGVPALKTKPISKASAIQRAGRAGRTQAGRCIRLYSQGDFESRPPFETPEIKRADLSQSLLEILAMNPGGTQDLLWYDAPAETALEASWTLLYRLGAITQSQSNTQLTELGKKMARIPAHPRISRFLIEAEKLGCLSQACTLAVLISEGQLESLDPMSAIARARLTELQKRSMSQWRDLLVNSNKISNGVPDPHALQKAILAGFPDRVSKKRKLASTSQREKSGSTEILLSSGGAASVEEAGHILESELFVTLDVREVQSPGQNRAKLIIGCLSPIEMDWLVEMEPCLLEDRTLCTWDENRERVLSIAQTVYNDLVLEESIKPATASALSGGVLLRATLGLDPKKLSALSAYDWVQAFSHLGNTELIEETLARLELFKKYFPNLINCDFSEILGIFERFVSLAELKALDWPNEIMMSIGQIGENSPQILEKIDRYLPLTLALPSGRKAKIHYSLEKAPWVESRLQDFFGMRNAPTLMDGRLPLLLHLLAPNHRAIQVTTDLAGFWERGYQEQRHALSRRYPRHAWPENPLEFKKSGQ